MKRAFILLILVACLTSLLGASSTWTDEDRQIEAEQVALWERKLAEAANDTPNVKFSELWLGLRNMGHRVSSEGHSHDVDVIYKRIQSEFLSIPGHAEYFGKRIHEAYEPLKGPNPGIAIGDAQNEMMYSFGTLKNLPSPETVKVLGEMLSESWRLKQPPAVLGGELEYTPPSLALSAVASALIDLPLRETPEMSPVMWGEDPEVVMVRPWQNWYAEIKSGKRTFSFKGQSVEYRFNPNGTWETLAMANPPDDGLKPQPSKPEAARPEKSAPPPPPAREAPARPSSTTTVSRSIYGWVIGCGILVLAAIAVLFKRRHGSK